MPLVQCARVEELLRQQEYKLLKALSGAELDSNESNGASFGELTSTRIYRESWLKLSSDKLLSQTIKDGPENQVLLGMTFLKHLELVQKGNQLTIRQ